MLGKGILKLGHLSLQSTKPNSWWALTKALLSRRWAPPCRFGAHWRGGAPSPWCLLQSIVTRLPPSRHPVDPPSCHLVNTRSAQLMLALPSSRSSAFPT